MSELEKEEFYYRVIVALVATFCSLIVIGLGYGLSSPQAAGDTSIRLADVLFDRSAATYPVTIQNLMWFFFFFCLGELWVRWDRASKEKAQLNRNVLSDDTSILYRRKDLAPVFMALKSDSTSTHYFLQRALLRIVQQFQTSSSTDQANSVLNSSLELMQHEVELKYNMIRYLVWLIPTLGFIGTVIGIALALSAAGDMPSLEDSAAIKLWVANLTTKLAVAFNTTLLALIMSAALVFIMHMAQGREELTLNYVGQYCLDRLVNRLYEENN